MKQDIDYIITWLDKRNRNISNILQPGLRKDLIIEKLKEYELEAPKELIELYSIFNGVFSEPEDILDELHLFPGFYFIPLEECLQYYVNFKSDGRWKDNWLPIFANGGGDFYIVECDKSYSRSPVIGFMLGRDDHEYEYSSLQTMFKTIATCYREGVYFVEDGYLESDIHKETLIGLQLNPDLSFWRELIESEE